MPSFEIWRDYKAHTSEESWDAMFEFDSEQYPWKKKKTKALWRRSTTYLPNYIGLDLNETPRGRLVQLGMDHPGLIDAAFVKFNQQYKNIPRTTMMNKAGRKTLRYSSLHGNVTHETIVMVEVEFEAMMKYKALLILMGAIGCLASRSSCA